VKKFKLSVSYFDVQKEFPIEQGTKVLDSEPQRALMNFLYAKGQPRMEIGEVRELKITITREE
jgi:hypothetical protein